MELPLLMDSGLGLLTGLVHQVTLIYWMTVTMNQYGELPWAVSIPVMLLLAAYLALYTWRFFLAPGEIYSKALAEDHRHSLSLGGPGIHSEPTCLRVFPGSSLGYSQYANLHWIQMADFSGVYGVSFLVALINAMVFFTLQARGEAMSNKNAPQVSGLVLGIPATGLAILILVWLYGDYRIRQTDEQIKNSPFGKDWPLFRAISSRA